MNKPKKPELSFRRFEFKYVLPAKLADIILASISNFVTPDPYTGHKDHYFVNSIYLDSPRFHCYQDKLDGIRSRKKFRIRFYQEKPQSSKHDLFFEIKRKIDAVIFKERVAISPKLLEKISPSAWKTVANKNPSFFSEFYYAYCRLNLSPKVFVHYKRKPYFSKWQKSFRITFDYDIKGAKVNSLTPTHYYTQNILHNQAVMEVKFNGVIPPWFSYIIKSNNLKRDSFSKYCHTVNKLYNLNDF